MRLSSWKATGCRADWSLPARPVGRSESPLHLIGSETITTWEWIVLIVIGALLFEFLVKREFVRLNERVSKLEKRVTQLEDRKD
jgi:hypothetical protein